jgi:thiol reductant ABC exporter CydD subunit
VRALDPRLFRRVRGARVALGCDVVLGLLATVAVLLHAVLFATIVVTAFRGELPSASTIAALAAIVLARGILAGGFESVGRRAAVRVLSQLRITLVERRLSEAPLADDGAEAAEIATAAVQGVDGLQTYFARYLPQLALAVLVPVVVLAWTAAIDLTSAAIMLVTLPIIPVFMVLIGRATEARTRARWEALSRLSTHFVDVVRGLPTLRAFNRSEPQAARLDESSEEYRRTTMDVLRVSFVSGAVLDLTATIATALVAVTFGVRLVDGAIGLGAALTILLLTPELYAPLRALAAQFHASADGLAAADRIIDLIEGTSPTMARGGTVPPPAWRSVRLERVRVRHADRETAVLDGFDLEIRRGEVVALTGASGAGKSTVASLLLGLRSPDAGAVMIGGHDLASLDVETWRRQVAWVPQHPTMFRASALENVAMSDRGASETTVGEAVRAAAAEEFLADLPRGPDTVIGDGGRGLSAGESTRVAVARALVRSSDLVILDEPTSGLDEETAARVLSAIRRATADRAVLLIEHRPERASTADRMVHLVNGRAVEPVRAAT